MFPLIIGSHYQCLQVKVICHLLLLDPSLYSSFILSSSYLHERFCLRQIFKIKGSVAVVVT